MLLLCMHHQLEIKMFYLRKLAQGNSGLTIQDFCICSFTPKTHPFIVSVRLKAPGIKLTISLQPDVTARKIWIKLDIKNLEF